MAYTAAVITVSDKGSRGEREDTSGPAVRKILEDAGFSVVHTCILPDEKDEIEKELIRCADERHISLVMLLRLRFPSLAYSDQTVRMSFILMPVFAEYRL